MATGCHRIYPVTECRSSHFPDSPLYKNVKGKVNVTGIGKAAVFSLTVPVQKTAPMSTKSILKAGEFPNQFYVPDGTVIKHKRRYCIVLRFTSSSSAASLHSFLFPALPYTGQAGSQSKNFSLHKDQTETGSGCTKYSCLENQEKSMRYQKKNSTCHDQLCQMQMCFPTT